MFTHRSEENERLSTHNSDDAKSSNPESESVTKYHAIKITHQNIVMRSLRFAKMEIDGESQWVAAAAEFAIILTPITNLGAITSRTFPRAGVVHRECIKFQYGQRCKPLTAVDACQYLSHLTKKYENDSPIIANSMQIFKQLLIIKTDGSTTTAMWRLDSSIKSIALSHSVPWLIREKKSGIAIGENESKISHSATITTLSQSDIDAAILQLSPFLSKSINTKAAPKSKKKKKPAVAASIHKHKAIPITNKTKETNTTLTSLEDKKEQLKKAPSSLLDYLEPENCSLVEITYNNITVAKLHFLKTNIDKKIQWVVARRDFANMVSDATQRKTLKNVALRDLILFGFDQKDRPLTASDACQYLYYIVNECNDEQMKINAIQILLHLLTIKTNDFPASATWISNLEKINSIALPHPAPWVTKKGKNSSNEEKSNSTTLPVITDKIRAEMVNTAKMLLSNFSPKMKTSAVTASIYKHKAIPIANEPKVTSTTVMKLAVNNLIDARSLSDNLIDGLEYNDRLLNDNPEKFNEWQNDPLSLAMLESESSHSASSNSHDAKSSDPKSKPVNYHVIKIIHEDRLITNLRFAREVIDQKLQWVVAALELAYILSPITTMRKSVSSYNITRLAGVKNRDSVSFGFGQRQRPLTAYDACQYLNHIINTYDNESIETNALQFFIQLLTINTDDSSPTAIWKSDLTSTKTVILPYPTPWFNEVISSASINDTQKRVNKILIDSHSSISSMNTIALPQDLVATAKYRLSSLFPSASATKLAATKPSTFHSTNTNIAPAATTIMIEKFKTYFTIAATESKKNLGEIELAAKYEQYSITAMNEHYCKATLYFREIIINKKSQLIIRAVDLINALLPKKTSVSTHYFGFAGIELRPSIEFKINRNINVKHAFFTVNDALVFLNYIITKSSEQSSIDSAYAIIEKLFVEDPISNSLTWITDIKNKTSISLQPTMSTRPLSVNSSTTSSTTSITRETSITTTNLEDKNSINKKSISDNPAYGLEYDDGLVNDSPEQFDHWQSDLSKWTASETTSLSHSAIGQQLSAAAIPSPRFSRSTSSFGTITPDDSESVISDEQVEQFLNPNAFLLSSDEGSLSATETHIPPFLESVSTNYYNELSRYQPNSPLSLNSSDCFFFHPTTAVMRSDSHHEIRMDRQEKETLSIHNSDDAKSSAPKPTPTPAAKKRALPSDKEQSLNERQKNITSISIQLPMSTLPLATISSSTSASTTSIARETSATATDSAIRQSLSDHAKHSGPESKSTSVTKYHAIKIIHEDRLITTLRFAREVIDQKLQWVVAGLELANILSPITTEKKNISSYIISRLAGVKHRGSVSFGSGQRQRPLTAYDACQYLNHIINTHYNESIETNALQFFIQLLTINTDDSSITPIWKSDLTTTKTVILPHPTPWLNEVISSASINNTPKRANKILIDSHSSISSMNTITLPQDLVATAKYLLSSLFPSAPATKLAATKPSTFHSTNTNITPLATTIMIGKLKTYFTIAAIESKKNLGEIELAAKYEQYRITAMNGHYCKATLYFREIIINKKSQLVIRAIDLINILLPGKAYTIDSFDYAGIKPRPSIGFKIGRNINVKHAFFTMNDALVFLNYIITKSSEQSSIDSAYAIIEELFVEDPISKSLTWTDNIKNKISISLQPTMSTRPLSAYSSTTNSATLITRETSIIATNLEDKNSINKKSISDKQVEQSLNPSALSSDKSLLPATETYTSHLSESVPTNSRNELSHYQPNSPLSLNSSSRFFSHPATPVMRSDSHHGTSIDTQEKDLFNESFPMHEAAINPTATNKKRTFPGDAKQPFNKRQKI